MRTRTCLLPVYETREEYFEVGRCETNSPTTRIHNTLESVVVDESSRLLPCADPANPGAAGQTSATPSTAADLDTEEPHYTEISGETQTARQGHLSEEVHYGSILQPYGEVCASSKKGHRTTHKYINRVTQTDPGRSRRKIRFNPPSYYAHDTLLRQEKQQFNGMVLFVACCVTMLLVFLWLLSGDDFMHHHPPRDGADYDANSALKVTQVDTLSPD
ncbi:hypothetical protein BDZ91DRAFT_797089 [Kalaharituber pfeilii]|nr:hypothetical protein BDZ91DRAFT_797089 [Kalaharituber pfeilii]